MKNFEEGQESKGRRVGQSVQEKVFGTAFELYLLRNRNKRRFAKFDYLLKEIPAAVGVADIIAISAFNRNQSTIRFLQRFDQLPILGTSFILAELRHHRNTSRSELLKRSPYSVRFTQAVISEMKKLGVLFENENGQIRLGNRFQMPLIHITFFELKINDWQRAYFQAAQAQSYADRAYCVLPSGKKKLLLKNEKLFSQAGIGVIVFDAENLIATEIVRAKANSPKRPAHKIHTLFRLARSSAKYFRKSKSRNRRPRKN